MMALAALIAAAGLTGVLAAAGTGPQGYAAFNRRCAGCHDPDRAGVGPPLRHVFGRRAAGYPKFPYSDALKKASITWDAVSLDRWLTDPDSFVPENDMSFRLEKAEERAAIVAYLRELSGK